MDDLTWWRFFYACAILTLAGLGVFFSGNPEWGAWIVGMGAGLGITLVYFIVIKIVEQYKGEGT